MKKYVPYLIAGVVAGLIVKYTDIKSGVNTIATRPEAETGYSWWKFW